MQIDLRISLKLTETIIPHTADDGLSNTRELISIDVHIMVGYVALTYR